MRMTFLLLLLCCSYLVKAQESINIVVAEGDFYPYEYVENNQFKGSHFDTIRAAAIALDINVTFTPRPWQRAIEEVKQGKADAISYIAKNGNRAKFADFLPGNILSTSQTWLIALAERANEITFDQNLTKMKHYVFGVGAGFAYGEPFDSMAKTINKYEVDVPTLARMAKMLETKRIDIMLGSKRNLLKLYSEQEIEQRFYIFPQTVAKVHNYLAFAKASRNHHFAEKFAQAIKQYKASPECQKMQASYNQHSSVKINDCQ